MELSEIRQDKVTRQWVIYAPSRRERPSDFRKPEKRETVPSSDPRCPFCPDNEITFPPIIEEYRRSDNLVQVRVVPKKFPALTPQGNLEISCEGIYLKMGGYGHHEVVIAPPPP